MTEPVLDWESLHGLLLDLAGRVPDDGLAVMRTCLADEDLEDLAEMLVTAARTGKVGLTEGEAALLTALLEEGSMSAGPVQAAPRLDALGPTPYTFAPSPAAAPGDPAVNGAGPASGDAALAAVVEAADEVGGLLALWRATRWTGEESGQVWLGEAAEDADLVELTAELQQAVAEAGDDVPRVEVFAEGAVLAPYHEEALAAASLLWLAEEPVQVKLARVFDGADAERGPFFEPDHPVLEGEDAAKASEYLRTAPLMLATPGAMDDVVTTDRLGTVPVNFRSDGEWVWTDAVAYYLDEHRLAPQPELAEQALAGPPPARLSRRVHHRVMAALTATPEQEPVWQPG